MSTPAIIGIVDLDQRGSPCDWRAVYCHWSGYPGEVGWLLQTFYDRAAAETLIAGGAVSRLGPDPRRAPPCGMIPTPPLPGTTASYPATRAKETWQASAMWEINRCATAWGSPGRPTPGTPYGSTCRRRGRTSPTGDGDGNVVGLLHQRRRGASDWAGLEGDLSAFAPSLAAALDGWRRGSYCHLAMACLTMAGVAASTSSSSPD